MKKSSSLFHKAPEWRGNALVLHFNGGAYHIVDAPLDLHERLVAAESQGKFYNEHIKGKFTLVKGEPKND